MFFLQLGGKTPATVEERGLPWEDNWAKFPADGQALLETGICAYTDGWQVEFSGRASASCFASISASFGQEVPAPSSHASVNAGCYASYSLTAGNGSCYFTTCIDRTVLLAAADEAYKKDAKDIIKVLGC